MQILLTGTGAADGIPALFAQSEISRRVRDKGGKELRLRAGALIDGRLKIDFGADTLAQAHALRLNPAEWTHIVFTHSHDDHYAPRELQYLFPPFVPLEETKPTVYGNQAILDGFEGAFTDSAALPKQLIHSFETVQVGDYRLTPVKAYHKLDEDSLNLLIRKDERTFLYAADTGVYQEETWDFLRDWKLDAMVIECTDGFNPSDYWGHLSCEQVVSVVTRLRKMGCLSERSIVCTTHHGHQGLGMHSDFEAFFNPHGIEVGFDGKLLEI